jgi:hypothetical protein
MRGLVAVAKIRNEKKEPGYVNESLHPRLLDICELAALTLSKTESATSSAYCLTS